METEAELKGDTWSAGEDRFIQLLVDVGERGGLQGR